MLRQYREEIDRLRAMVDQGDGGAKLAALEAERDALARDIEGLRGLLVAGKADEGVREKRRERQAVARRRQADLEAALAAIEEGEARDVIHSHYENIEVELQASREALKHRKLRIRALQREINDLHAEFQLDRADYLETIRRLERTIKLHEQLLKEAAPSLRKDGRQWDLDSIKANAVWCEDGARWQLPQELLQRLKLPPAERCASAQGTPMPPSSPPLDPLRLKLQRSDGASIADTYFRPRRAAELLRAPREAWHETRRWPAVKEIWTPHTR